MLRPFLIAVPLAMMCGACAHHVAYTYEGRHTSIDTDPPGARVYQLAPGTGERIDLGTTPIRDQPVMVITGANVGPHTQDIPALYAQHEIVRVEISKPGYRTYYGNLTTGPKETITHKIILEKQ